MAADRVRAHSSAKVNERLDRETAERLQRVSRRPTAELLRRLSELDREWDVDRALMLNFAVLGGLTFGVGMSRIGGWRRRDPWLLLFTAQLGFLALHAIRGWCPPLPVFRRLGVRTQKEIQVERECTERILRERNAQVVGAVAPPVPGPPAPSTH